MDSILTRTNKFWYDDRSIFCVWVELLNGRYIDENMTTQTVYSSCEFSVYIKYVFGSWNIFICWNLNIIVIYLPIMSNPFWGPRHIRIKLQEY